MLRNAEYIMNNIIIADGFNTRINFCKQAQVGVDLSVQSIYKIKGMGIITNDKSYIPPYEIINTEAFNIKKDNKDISVEGWNLKVGNYIVTLNEGCKFGPTDTGYIIMRSSLNRSGVTVHSAVWDPGYTSKNKNSKIIEPMSVRLEVGDNGIFLQKNVRICQLIVFENEDVKSLYSGQFQGGSLTSNIE